MTDVWRMRMSLIRHERWLRNMRYGIASIRLNGNDTADMRTMQAMLGEVEQTLHRCQLLLG